MKERPILFSGPMVRAILEGRKTQTRRVIKTRNDGDIIGAAGPGMAMETLGYDGECEQVRTVICPYGQPGDRLWVREAFGYEARSLGGTPHEQVVYRASKPDAVICYDCNGAAQSMNWRPSIHMPRWASRITLEITGVRVECLQDISRGDSMSEGCPFPNMAGGDDPRKWFSDLWESINGPGSWDANPWVWVVEFNRVVGDI